MSHSWKRITFHCYWSVAWLTACRLWSWCQTCFCPAVSQISDAWPGRDTSSRSLRWERLLGCKSQKELKSWLSLTGVLVIGLHPLCHIPVCHMPDPRCVEPSVSKVLSHVSLPLHLCLWQTRRSMVFSKHLRLLGDDFRAKYLNSTDDRDHTVYSEDWTRMKVSFYNPFLRALHHLFAMCHSSFGMLLRH